MVTVPAPLLHCIVSFTQGSNTLVNAVNQGYRVCSLFCLSIC
jgi:hypothetical protein